MITIDKDCKLHLHDAGNTIVFATDYVEQLQQELDKYKSENAKLKLDLSGSTFCYDEEEHKELKEQLDQKNKIIADLIEYLKEKLGKSVNLCLEFISQDTVDKVVGYNIALTTKNDIEHVLDKIKELEKGKSKWKKR